MQLSSGHEPLPIVQYHTVPIDTFALTLAGTIAHKSPSHQSGAKTGPPVDDPPNWTAEAVTPSRLAALPLDFSSSVAYSISLRLPFGGRVPGSSRSSLLQRDPKVRRSGPTKAKHAQADVFPYHNGSSLAKKHQCLECCRASLSLKGAKNGNACCMAAAHVYT